MIPETPGMVPETTGQIPETPEELHAFIDKTIATLEGVQDRLKKSLVTQSGKSSSR